MAVSIQRHDDSVLPPHELALDYFILGGFRSPGKCEVRGASREWDWQILQAVGMDGASVKLVSRKLVEFDITIALVSQKELALWDDFYANVLKNPVHPDKAGSRALGIYHPRLARVGIVACVLKKIGQFDQGRTGGETVTLSFLEYRAPKFVHTKPNGAIPAATKPQPKSTDALDEAIDVETQRNKALKAADAAH